MCSVLRLSGYGCGTVHMYFSVMLFKCSTFRCATFAMKALVRRPQNADNTAVLADAFPDLKSLALGGEPVPWALLREWVTPGSCE